jgi:hypothetical protein
VTTTPSPMNAECVIEAATAAGMETDIKPYMRWPSVKSANPDICCVLAVSCPAPTPFTLPIDEDNDPASGLNCQPRRQTLEPPGLGY